MPTKKTSPVPSIVLWAKNPTNNKLEPILIEINPHVMSLTVRYNEDIISDELDACRYPLSLAREIAKLVEKKNPTVNLRPLRYLAAQIMAMVHATPDPED